MEQKIQKTEIQNNNQGDQQNTKYKKRKKNADNTSIKNLSRYFIGLMREKNQKIKDKNQNTEVKDSNLQKNQLQSMNQKDQNIINQQFQKSFAIGGFRKLVRKLQQDPSKEKIQEFKHLTMFTDEAIQKILQIENISESEELKDIRHIIMYYQTCYNQLASLSVINNYIRNIKANNLVQMKEINNEDIPSIEWHKLPKYVVPDLVNYTLYYQIKFKKDWPNVVKKLLFLKKKRRQLEYFIVLLGQLIKQRKERGLKAQKIVDFAGGKGDLALIIAYMFPDVHVTVVDINPKTLIMAKYRKEQMKMQNVDTILGDIRQYKGQFDIAIGLHACGGLTDILLEKCKEQIVQPSILVCTCCFGKMKHFQDMFQYPKSEEVQQILEKQEYLQLGNFAEADTIADLVENFLYAHEKNHTYDMENHPYYKYFKIDTEYCKKQFDIESLKELPSYCRQFINSDRISEFNIFIDQNQKWQEKDIQNQKKKPYLIKIPSKYTLRNQFFVLD